MMENDEYPEWGDCNYCEHQGDICTNCMEKNSIGEWHRAKFAPKPGVYKVAESKTVTVENRQ